MGTLMDAMAHNPSVTHKHFKKRYLQGLSEDPAPTGQTATQAQEETACKALLQLARAEVCPQDENSIGKEDSSRSKNSGNMVNAEDDQPLNLSTERTLRATNQSLIDSVIDKLCASSTREFKKFSDMPDKGINSLLQKALGNNNLKTSNGDAMKRYQPVQDSLLVKLYQHSKRPSPPEAAVNGEKKLKTEPERIRSQTTTSPRKKPAKRFTPQRSEASTSLDVQPDSSTGDHIRVQPPPATLQVFGTDSDHLVTSSNHQRKPKDPPPFSKHSPT